jgi:hypothetical protein
MGTTRNLRATSPVPALAGHGHFFAYSESLTPESRGVRSSAVVVTLTWTGFAGALAIVGLAACSGAKSVDGVTARDAGHTVVPVAAFGESACGKCVLAACSTDVTACSTDPGCAAHLTCVEECGVTASGNVDESCVAKCPGAASGPGQSAEHAFDGCRSAGPGAECSACGGHVDSGAAKPEGGSPVDGGVKNPSIDQVCPPYTGTSACDTCKQTHCCETRARCNDDPNCSSYIDCMAACVSADGGTFTGCTATCDKKYPGAYLPYNEEFDCITLFCPEECGAPAPDPCEHCANTVCARAQANCDVDESCSRFTQCLGDCNDQSCQAACAAPYSQATQNLGLGIGICVTNQCGDVCAN